MKGNSKRHYISQARAIYRYNVCKKVSQLNKVIQLFLAQASEDQYHSLLIRKNYEKALSQVFKNYESSIIPLQKETNNLHYKVDSQISRDYLDKVTEIQKDFNEEVNSIKSSIESVLNDVQNLVNLLNQVKTSDFQEINQLKDIYSQFTTTQFENLQNQISKMIKQFSAEINTIENEAIIKIDSLQKKSQETLKKLTDQHFNELNKIQTEKFIQIGIDPTIKDQLTTKQNQIIRLNEDFQRYFNTFHKNLYECRSKLKELNSFYSYDISAYEKALNSLEIKYNQTDHEMLNEKSQFESEITAKEAQFEKEINEKQNELSTLIQQLNNELIEKTDSLKNGLFNSNSSINELIIKLTKEKDEVMSKYEIEKKDKIENTVQSLLDLNQKEENQFTSSKNELENSLQKLKEDHFIEKASNLSLHQEMTENEINHFSEEMMKLRQSIQSASKDSNSILFQTKQTLSNLQNEKDEFQFNINAQVNKFNAEENDEINRLNKQYLYDLEQNENVQTEQLNSLTISNNELIRKNSEEYKMKKEEILMKYEREREELLNNIRLEYIELNEKELNEINKEFSSLYDEQSLLLTKIEPPSKSDEFSQLTNEVNDLAIKRSELLRTISIQKNTLLQMHEDEINNEKLRHEQFLEDLKNTGRKINGRDTLRNTMRMKINDIKREKDEEMEKHRSLLNQMNNEHRIKLDQLSLELKIEKNLLEKAENELRDQISIENINSKNEIEFAENNYQKDKFTLNNEMIVLQNDYNLKINEFKEKNILLINDFKIEIESLNNELHNIHLNETSEKDKQTRIHLLNFSSMKNSHHSRLVEMNDMLSEMGASIARFNIQYRNDLESIKKENNKSISLTVINNEKEKAELIQNKESLSVFLEEKIDVLVDLNEKAKEKYLNRPSRDIEIEKIKKYEKHCALLTKVLKNGVNDIIAYRKINAAKEKEYNMMFGRNPSVGVLIVGSSRSNYQYY